MKITTTNSILFWCFLFSILAQNTFAQSTTIGASSVFLNNNGTGMNTFNFRNNNTYPVIITTIEGIVSTSVANNCEVWYMPTALTAAPTAITPANGWTLAMSGAFTGVANSTTMVTQPFITNGNFVIPAGATYALCVSATSQRYYSIPAATPATVFATGGGCDMIFSSTYSYGGGVPPATPGNASRGWIGKITFVPGMAGYNNASAAVLVSPQKFCSTTQPVSVRIKNSGRNQINPVTVSWDVDAVAQTPMVFSSLLDTAGGTGPNDTLLTLGNLTFTPGIAKTVRIWTELPNNIADTVTNDDTLYAVFRTGLNGTYAIGPSSTDYTTISAAVNDLNKYGICGPVTFNVDANSIYTENPIILTQTGTVTNTITFQKSGAGTNPIVYGKNGKGTLDAVIALSGVSYVTFDGIDVADSTSNASTTTQMEYGYGIVNSTSTNGSSNNTIKNCKVTLRRSYTATIGIAQSTLSVATALSGGNHNNRYQNVKIENSYNGIALLGTDVFPDSNNVITSTGGDTTIIGANTSNDIGGGTAIVTGINVTQQKNVEVSNCIVRNLQHTASLLSSGIWLNNTSASVNYGTAKIFNNQVYNLRRTTITTGVAAAAIIGIRIEVALLASARVYNNIIHNMSSTNTTASVATGLTVRGISHGQSTGTGTAEYYHNSVHLTNTNPTATTVAFFKSGTSTVTVRNNIFSDSSVANTGTARHYAEYISNGSTIASNNVLWSTPNGNGLAGFAASAARATLPLFAAAISGVAPSDGNELGSAFVNPNFVSGSDLTFATATAAALSGTQINSFVISTDITGGARSVLTPSIGAYETAQTLFDSAAPVISNIVIKSGAAPSVYAVIKDNNTLASSAGSVQLWYRLGTSGAFTPLAPDSVPVGTMNGSYKWGSSLTAVATGTYQFYISARDIVAPGSNISTNPIQALTFSGFSATDPVNYLTNPDPGVNTRTFGKFTVLTGGTYTVGPTGAYLKLTDAANALSTSDLTGNVIFQLQPSYDGTTGETFPITFTQFASTGGNWTATIRPATGATALHVKGSNATLIDLNGVKRLTFDGRPGGIGSTQQLTFTNTSTSGIAVRFINDAQNDTLRYLNIVDSNNVVTSGGIVFSTTNAGTEASGNSYNLIDRCNINGSSASANGIYSAGTAAPADNKNNTITNCNIFDFFSNSVAQVNGILLAAGNSSWNIGTTGNGNNFYQTAVRDSFSNPALTTAVGFRAIQINDVNVGGCSIVDNRIGGNIPGIPGSVFVVGGAFGTSFLSSYIRAIDIVASSSTVATSIQGNTISDMTIYTGISAGYAGIHVLGGLVNTGNLVGNTIGSPTGTGSIKLYYKSTTTGANLYGIRYSGAHSGLIQNNTIGSITNDASAGSDQLVLIYGSGTHVAPLTISNNTIGSLTTMHSVQSTASSVGHINIMGIVLSAAQGAAISITNNTVMNLSSLCTTLATTNGLKGIYVTGASTVSTTISDNTIRKLYSESTNPSIDQSSAIVGINCTSSGVGIQTITNNTISALMSGAITGAINVVGIYYGSTVTGGPSRIERNLIHSLSASPSNGSALISGITQGAGTAKLIIANNMVRLGLDSTGASAIGPHFITGIQKTAGSENITVFNSVNIGGTGVSNGVSASYAYRSNNVGIDSLMNNIFMNTRTNATTGANHYAIGLNAATTLKINSNLYNSSSVFGQFGGIDQATIFDWRTATAQDLNSVNITANFVSNTDLHLTGASQGNLALAGTPLAAYTTDFDNQTRHVFAPYIGADETTPTLPVELTLFGVKQVEYNALLYWTTASENNASHFEIERSLDGKHFEYVTQVKAAGNSQNTNNYNFTDKDILKNNTLVYYRLKIVDNDGTFDFSKIVSVGTNDVVENIEMVLYPNPVNNEMFVSYSTTNTEPTIITIKDISGKTLFEQSQTSTIGINKTPIDMSELHAGIYFVSLETKGQLRTLKVIKQ